MWFLVSFFALFFSSLVHVFITQHEERFDMMITYVWVIAIYGHRNGHPRSNASDWLTASIRTTEPHYRNRTARSSKIKTDTCCVTATLFALQTRARERPHWHLTIVWLQKVLRNKALSIGGAWIESRAAWELEKVPLYIGSGAGEARQREGRSPVAR